MLTESKALTLAGAERQLTQALDQQKAILPALRRQVATGQVHPKILKEAARKEELLKEGLHKLPDSYIFLVDGTGSMDDGERRQADQTLEALQILAGEGKSVSVIFGDAVANKWGRYPDSVFDTTKMGTWLYHEPPKRTLSTVQTYGNANRHESPLKSLMEVLSDTKKTHTERPVVVYIVTDEYPDIRAEALNRLIRVYNSLHPESHIALFSGAACNEIDTAGNSLALDPQVERFLENIIKGNKNVVLNFVTPRRNEEDYTPDLDQLGLVAQVIAQMTGGQWFELGQSVTIHQHSPMAGAADTLNKAAQDDILRQAQNAMQVLQITAPQMSSGKAQSVVHI